MTSEEFFGRLRRSVREHLELSIELKAGNSIYRKYRIYCVVIGPLTVRCRRLLP